MSVLDDRPVRRGPARAGRRRPSCWFGYSPAARRSSRRVGRDPEVVLREAGPPADRRVGVREQRRRASSSGTSLYATGWPSRVAHVGVRRSATHATRAASIVALRAATRDSRRVAFCRNALPHGLSGPGGTRSASTSWTSFTGTVDVEVEARVEQVLVVRRGDARRRRRWRTRAACPARSPSATRCR